MFVVITAMIVLNESRIYKLSVTDIQDDWTSPQWTTRQHGDVMIILH